MKHSSAWSLYDEPQTRTQGKSQWEVQRCGKRAEDDDVDGEHDRFAFGPWQERLTV